MCLLVGNQIVSYFLLWNSAVNLFSREHAMLAKTAGVKHLVILVNKMDDPTVEWDEARFVSEGISDAFPVIH